MTFEMNVFTIIVDELDEELSSLLPKISLIKTEYSIVAMIKRTICITGDDTPVDHMSTLFTIRLNPNYIMFRDDINFDNVKLEYNNPNCITTIINNCQRSYNQWLEHQ